MALPIKVPRRPGWLENHPPIPAEIPDEKFWACRRFLSHFIGGAGGQVYSLNYDLLLYWTLMHEDMPFGAPIPLEKNDEFGNDEDDLEADGKQATKRRPGVS